MKIQVNVPEGWEISGKPYIVLGCEPSIRVPTKHIEYREPGTPIDYLKQVEVRNYSGANWKTRTLLAGIDPHQTTHPFLCREDNGKPSSWRHARIRVKPTQDDCVEVNLPRDWVVDSTKCQSTGRTSSNTGEVVIPIRQKAPSYRKPTQADVGKGVEVSSSPSEYCRNWYDRTLLGVSPIEVDNPYWTVNPITGKQASWNHARIRCE